MASNWIKSAPQKYVTTFALLCLHPSSMFWFLAALAILNPDDMKKRMNCTRMIWRKEGIHPILRIYLGKIASVARNLINSVPQTTAIINNYPLPSLLYKSCFYVCSPCFPIGGDRKPVLRSLDWHSARDQLQRHQCIHHHLLLSHSLQAQGPLQVRANRNLLSLYLKYIPLLHLSSFLPTFKFSACLGFISWLICIDLERISWTNAFHFSFYLLDELNKSFWPTIRVGWANIFFLGGGHLK